MPAVKTVTAKVMAYTFDCTRRNKGQRQQLCNSTSADGEDKMAAVEI